MKLFPLILSLMLLTSCAHELHGNPTKVTAMEVETLPIDFKAYEDSKLSTDRFIFLQMSFKNNQEDWMRIKEAELVPENEEQARAIHILLGQDLKAWSKGTEERIKIEDHNFNMLMGAIFAASMVGAYATAKNGDFNSAKNILGVGVTASAIGSGKELYDRVRELNRGGMMPEGHILAPFSVPPGMVSRHWVVIEKPKDLKLTHLGLKLKSLDGRSTTYKLEL